MPVITKPNQHFDAPIWTGVSTSSAITISSLNFQPDLVWGKSRTSAYTHGLHDSVRGIAAGRLQSNATTAEVAPGSFAYGSVSAFNSNGFTASPGSSTNENWNETSSNHVAWCWKAGGAAVANTSGTIASQVSVNSTAGFSIVTYTGTGANATVGHGLGVAPSMYIVKRRNAVDSWFVYSNQLAATQYLRLESTNAAATFNFWQNTAPTSSVFYISTDVSVNASSDTYVSYCFAPIAGYSAFGSYTGNGSSDGTFVFTGFRPRFVMWKRTDSVNDWYMIDTSRSPYNNATNPLAANLSSDESSLGTNIDFLSNGFKARQTGGHINASGGTYIYMAFAEATFKFANAR
jgi:hypothetical protein